MFKPLLLGLVLVTGVSCQTSRHHSPDKFDRKLASSSVFKTFIQQVSSRSKFSQKELEGAIIEYIKAKPSNATHGNYAAIGLTSEQAHQIKSLTDDLPYMPKVKKWAMENMRLIKPNISKKVMQKSYKEAVIGERGTLNPYKSYGSSSRDSVSKRQKLLSAFKSLSKKNRRILHELEDGISNKKIRDTYVKNLNKFKQRGKDSPEVLANGQEMVESATLITRKTGFQAMGDGCEAFHKTASVEVLEVKANVDIWRARFIEEAAYSKSGRTFASVDDIPVDQRLTQQEIDTATERALVKVLGYSPDEATAALSRLKGKPCKLY